MSGISIDMTVNAKDVIKGAAKVEGALDDVGKSLDELVKDSAKSGDKLGDNIGDGAKAAAASTDKLERSFADLARASKRDTATAGDAIKKNIDRGTDGAKEGLDDFKSESASTAREAAASFSGSADDIASSFQEVAANALAGFGPLGAAVGLVLAATIGIAIANGTEAAEALNDAKEKAGALALEIVDAGGSIDDVDLGAKIRDWSVEINDSRQWFEIWQAAAVSNIETASKYAKQFGADAVDMTRGLSGNDAAAALRTLEALADKVKASDDALAKAERSGGEYSKAAIVARQENISLHKSFDDLEPKLKIAAGVTGDAAAAAKLLAEVTAEDTAAIEAETAATDAANNALDIRNDKIGALQSGLDDAIGAYGDFADEESGALDPAAYIDAMDKRRTATEGFAGNVAALTTQFGLSNEEQQAILDMGLDFAPMLDSIIGSGMQGEFVAQLQGAVGGGQEVLDGANLNATVDATADVAPAEGDLDALTGEKRGTDVGVTAKTEPAKAKIDAVADKNYRATITADAHTGAAERAIDALVNKTRRVTIVATVVDKLGRTIP